MSSLSGLESFVKVAQMLSFAGAARELGISASAVGKNVARLEQQMGARLFQRSTRKVHLTAEGELFYERCRAILADLHDAQAMLSHTLEAPRGKLRVSLPTTGYRFLLPVLSEFRRVYPEVELDLDFNDQFVDVIAQGFDLALRSGDLPDSTLMARRLGGFRFVLCASPAYLKRAGTPQVPSDLQQHESLRYRFATTGKAMDWTSSANPEWTTQRMPSMLTFNNMEAVLMAAIDGHGIAYMPDFLARQALDNSLVQTVLDEYMLDDSQFWALWPSSRHLSPKIRAFVDFIATRLFADYDKPRTQHL